MNILGYIGYAILIFEAIAGIIYVRRRASGVPVIIVTVFFVTSSIILGVFGINKLHAWWLILTGFVLNFVILKVPAPVYAVPIKDLKGILYEWAKVSFFSPWVILIASVFAHIVRIGIPLEKIQDAQRRDAVDVIDRFSGNKMARLIQAAKDGNLQTVQTLLTDATDESTLVCPELSLVNARDNDGKTVLGWSAYKGHTEIVKLLFEKGAEVDSKTSKGVTALMMATDQNYIDITKLLLMKGADVNAKTTDNGQTALMTAVQKGHVAIVGLLLENGAEIDVKNNKGATALMVASLQGYTEIVNILLKKGADVNVKIDNGLTALEVARRNGHTDIVQLLEKAGARV
jgi:ankyrin repeat protein